MVTLVATFTAVLLSQLDAVPFDLVHGPDVNAVGADNFHVLFDVGHFECPLWNFHNAPGRVMFRTICRLLQVCLRAVRRRSRRNLLVLPSIIRATALGSCAATALSSISTQLYARPARHGPV